MYAQYNRKGKFEYKYIVPIYLLNKLRSSIGPFVKNDFYMCKGGPNGYTVRSIYYDTMDYTFYYEKLSGIKRRKKIRIRGYNDLNHDNIVFLEIKRKNNKLISKHRAPVKYSHIADLLDSGDTERYVVSDNGFKNAIEDSERFLYHIHHDSLQPLVMVIYEREAFFGKFDNSLRITFDKNLRCILYPDLKNFYGENSVRFPMSKYFILEVKFFHVFPSWLKPIIASYNLKLESCSKYTISVDEFNVVNKSILPMSQEFTGSINM